MIMNVANVLGVLPRYPCKNGRIALVSGVSVLWIISGSAQAVSRNVEWKNPTKNVVTLRALFRSATLSGVTISPNGRFVSVRVERKQLSKNTVRMSWYILRISDGRVIARTNGGNPYLMEDGDFGREMPQWSSNSRWLYFRAFDRGKVEIWRIGVNGKRQKVISRSSDIQGFTLDDSHHINRVFYWIGPSRTRLKLAKEREYRRGVILDGTQFLSMPIEDNMPVGSGMTTVRDVVVRGNLLTVPVGDDVVPTRMEYNFKTGITRTANSVPYEFNRFHAVEPVVRIPRVGVVASLAQSRLTGDIAFTKYKYAMEGSIGGDRLRRLVLGIVRARSGRIVWCDVPTGSSIEGPVVWRPGTNEFLFTTATERWHGKGSEHSGASDIVSMYAWNESRLTVRLVFRTLGTVGPAAWRYSEPGQCPVTQAFAVCAIGRPVAPPLLVKINLDNGRIAELFDPNSRLRKSIVTIGLPGHVKYMMWNDERGVAHTGVFLSAFTAKRNGLSAPLVVTTESCAGFLHGGAGSTVPEIILWEDGFAVLCDDMYRLMSPPNYRSHRVPKGKPTMMETSYDGLKSAVEILSRQGLVDRHHVGISGISYGANVVNWVITHHPDFAAAATAGHVASTTEPIDFYIYAGMGPRWLRTAISEMGVVDPMTSRGIAHYQVVSDVGRANMVCTPLLVQTDGPEFGGEGVEYYGALKYNNDPAEFIIFPNEAHNFWRPQNLWIVQERNIEWFRFWIQNDSSLENRSRFARWVRMRDRWRRVRKIKRRRCDNE